jgi:hypothetical protein
MNAHQDLQDLQDLQAHKEIQGLKDRLDQLETRALQENKELLALLVRLENVLATAQQFWYHKTTMLHWLIIMLALIVMDRLLLHFPAIVQIVTKLL